MADPMDLIDEAEGKSLTNIAKQGIGGWLLALAVAAITGVQQVVDLLVVTPVEVMTGVAETAAASILESPLDIIDSGAEESASAVAEFGIFAILVAVALVLASFWIVSQYLEREETSDLVPGIMVDVVPFVGVDEEED